MKHNHSQATVKAHSLSSRTLVTLRVRTIWQTKSLDKFVGQSAVALWASLSGCIVRVLKLPPGSSFSLNQRANCEGPYLTRPPWKSERSHAGLPRKWKHWERLGIFLSKLRTGASLWTPRFGKNPHRELSEPRTEANPGV